MLSITFEYRSNISDALQGVGNIDEALGWAERGLKVSTSQSGQECDEGCGVILYNLGMLHEVTCANPHSPESQVYANDIEGNEVTNTTISALLFTCD